MAMVAHAKAEGNTIESKFSQPPPAYHHQEEDHLSLQVFWNVNGDCVLMVMQTGPVSWIKAN
jgi:hypothetical protein